MVHSSILSRNACFLKYLTLQLSAFSSFGCQVPFQTSQSFLISNKPIYIHINIFLKKKNTLYSHSVMVALLRFCDESPLPREKLLCT